MARQNSSRRKSRWPGCAAAPAVRIADGGSTCSGSMLMDVVDFCIKVRRVGKRSCRGILAGAGSFGERSGHNSAVFARARTAESFHGSDYAADAWSGCLGLQEKV